jgi:hypothetical protein
MNSLEDELAGIAEMLGVKNPPDVDVVREILPEEYPELAVLCMKEQGFTVEILDGGVLTSTYPTDQKDAYNLAQYVCMAKYPHYPVFYLPKSDTTLRVMYDWATDNIIPCLAAEGVTVEDMPTFEVYRDRYRTEGATWNPLFDNPQSQCKDVPQQLLFDSAEQ